MVAVADYERSSSSDYLCSEYLGSEGMMYPTVETQVPWFTLPFQEDDRYNLVPDWRVRNAEREATFAALTESAQYRNLAPKQIAP